MTYCMVSISVSINPMTGKAAPMPPRTFRALQASDLQSVGGCQVYSPTKLRASLNSTESSSETKDGKKITVKTLVVYKIRDIIQAIGKANWDTDATVNDLTQSAVMRVVATHTLGEILGGIADESITATLTKEVRKELRQYGVYIVRAKLVNFAETKVFKLLTTQADHHAMNGSQFYL